MSNIDNEPFFIVPGGSSFGAVHATQGEFQVEAVHLDLTSQKPGFQAMKRILDIFISVIALVALAIPSVVIALLIKRESDGPVLSTREVVGKNGRSFTLINFRSTRTQTGRERLTWGALEDTDITTIGDFLRTTHMDAIPQLINVLRGDMSLVGPRPVREMSYEKLEAEIPGFSHRLYVRPGIAGLAQINGGLDLLPEEEIRYDVNYINNGSLRLDARIIARAFVDMFTR
ncbi:MAG: sugar transferase [Ancrocorticia sp.]